MRQAKVKNAGVQQLTSAHPSMPNITKKLRPDRSFMVWARIGWRVTSIKPSIKFDPSSRNALSAIAVVLLLMLMAGSVIYRLYKTKPLLKPDFPDARFTETWSSGQSNRNILAQLVGAKSFLWIIVTRDHLHVSPHFPFNLMFLPEAFGWDHRIPGKTIMDVRETSYDSDQRGVLIQYRHATGDEERLELQVSDIPALMKALADIRRQ